MKICDFFLARDTDGLWSFSNRHSSGFGLFFNLFFTYSVLSTLLSRRLNQIQLLSQSTAFLWCDPLTFFSSLYSLLFHLLLLDLFHFSPHWFRSIRDRLFSLVFTSARRSYWCILDMVIGLGFSFLFGGALQATDASYYPSILFLPPVFTFWFIVSVLVISSV